MVPSVTLNGISIRTGIIFSCRSLPAGSDYMASSTFRLLPR